MLTVLGLTFLATVLVGVPIAFSLGLAAAATLVAWGQVPLWLLAQRMFTGVDSFVFMAIPFFILAGELMTTAGILDRLVKFADGLVGHIRGGLAHVTIVAECFFSGISGSAVADAAALSAVLSPSMAKQYDPDFGNGVVASAAMLGPIIPPSIPFIIYGVSGNVSIAGLFLGGVGPGILLAGALMVYMYFVATKRNYPRDPKTSAKEVLIAAWKALPALFMPVLIMGGILSGMFTPTEAAGVTVIYAALMGAFYYRKLTIKSLPKVLLTSGLESGMVMLLIAMSEPFAWFVALDQIPQLIIEWISHLTTSPYVILILVNIFLLILGIPMETVPALVIVTPVLVPIGASVGIDPVHMGIVICLNLVLGLITPPVGAVLFAVCGMTNMSLDRLGRAIWPPFLVSLIVLAIVTYLPWLSTYLPRLVLGR